MFEYFRNILLRVLKVPHIPDPPAGSPESTKIFNAGKNLYTWIVIRWAFVETAILLGILGFTVALFLATRNPRMPDLVRLLLIALQLAVATAYLLQLPITFFALRLGFEMRWYIVTDRSLRIRAGVWSVEEITMTFANIQQIAVKQGPLQRVLGIADVEVTSAGGSAGKGPHGEQRSSGHTARFQGVDHADAIRDLILDRLRRYKDSGLGDPDDQPPVLTAAREVLAETRKLRAAVA
ncbi:MAG: PH domain-containing protein [Acidobacteriota bacterium]